MWRKNQDQDNLAFAIHAFAQNCALAECRSFEKRISSISFFLNCYCEVAKIGARQSRLGPLFWPCTWVNVRSSRTGTSGSPELLHASTVQISRQRCQIGKRLFDVRSDLIRHARPEDRESSIAFAVSCDARSMWNFQRFGSKLWKQDKVRCPSDPRKQPFDRQSFNVIVFFLSRFIRFLLCFL